MRTAVAIASVIAFALVETASSARAVRASIPGHQVGQIRVRVQLRVVEYGPSRVSVSGLAAAAVSVRLRGANDPRGLAYRWTPYRWRRLRLLRGSWRGVLSAPALRGIYQLQLRVQQSKRLLQSPQWLLRALPPGTLTRPAFPTPLAVIRDYVSDLPGNRVLVAARPWPQAAFDHRDQRLQRLFVIAYAPRGANQPSSRRGLFISTVRNGYHGRWRLLDATISPPD
jgi:hypothetical protein